MSCLGTEYHTAVQSITVMVLFNHSLILGQVYTICAILVL